MKHPTTEVETEQDDNDEIDALIEDIMTNKSLSVIQGNIESVTTTLENLEADDLDDVDDDALVGLRHAIKSLEEVVEETRKEVVDDEVKSRIEPGESLQGLSHVASHSKYVDENVGSVIARAISNGVDYTQFVDLNAPALADMDEDITEVGRYEYTYIR